MQREGTVVLWNDGGLPIAKDSQVSLFSHSGVDWVTSGWGSGAADTSGSPTMYLALQDAGLFVNYTLWRFYESGAGSGYKRVESSGVNEVPWSVYTSNGITDTFAEYGDAAIVVISRVGGENSDLYKSSEVSLEQGSYLALTQEEKDLLNEVCKYREQNVFKRVILVVNTGNTIQFGDFAPYIDNIDAAIYMGQAGTSGVNALAELLVGNENTSGRLADTLA